MDTYKTCKRRWFLQYYMRLKRKHQPPRIAADTGSAVHEALDRYYTLGGQGNHEMAYEAAMLTLEAGRESALARDLSTEEVKAIGEIFDTSEIVTDGYFAWLSETGADKDWVVKGSEERLLVDGPVAGTAISGYVDLWGEHEPSGDLLVVDTKVIANFGDTLKTLHINEQAPLYAMLMKMIDPDPDRGFRVVWNMIKRNKQTSRAKPPFYQRYELAINKDQLAQFYAQIHGQLSDMIDTERRLDNGEHHYMVAYPTPSRDCSWKCPYVAICGAMNDPRTDVDWIINNNYEQWEEKPKMDDTVVTDEQ
jgi:hypothetical protein